MTTKRNVKIFTRNKSGPAKALLLLHVFYRFHLRYPEWCLECNVSTVKGWDSEDSGNLRELNMVLSHATPLAHLNSHFVENERVRLESRAMALTPGFTLKVLEKL